MGGNESRVANYFVSLLAHKILSTLDPSSASLCDMSVLDQTPTKAKLFAFSSPHIK